MRLLFLFLLSVNFVFSQEDEVKVIKKSSGEYHQDNLLRAYSSTSGGFWNRDVSKYSKIEGTPYLYDNWESELEITTKDNKIFKFKNSNYDLIEDIFVTKLSKDSVFSFNNSGIDLVKIKNKTFKKIKKTDADMFFEVLLDGKRVAFLKRYYKKIRKGRRDPMTRERLSKDKYLEAHKHYLYENNELIKISLRKKNVITNLRDKNKKELLSKYVKENKLSYKKEKDVISILNYYNSL